MISSTAILFSSSFKRYFAHYQGLPRSCWQGIAIEFLDSTLVGVCYFLSIYFVNELHIDITKSGMMLAFYGVGTILGGFLGGKLSDRFSASKIAIASLLLQAFAFLLLIKIKSPIYLMMILFCLGLSGYAFITSNHVWILKQCDKVEGAKLKALNILTVVANLGLGLSALIISFFANLNFVYMFFTCGLLILLSAFYLMYVEMHAEKPSVAVEEIKPEQTISINANPNTTILLLALISIFLIGFIIAQYNSTYPLYIQSTFPEWGVKAVSILFMLNTFMVVIFQTPIVNLFANKNKILVMGTGALLFGIGMTILSITSGFLLVILACILETIGEILFFAVAQLLCYENVPADKKGHALGLYRTVYASCRIIGPAAGAVIFEYVSGAFLWQFCALLAVICFGLCWKWRGLTN